jgi:hypothetical protein
LNQDRSRVSPGARRYLLGQASEEESAAFEREYFANADALDRVEAVEETLIEEYLADSLPADERTQFERVYLASRQHRSRVAIVRRLMRAAGTAAPTRDRPWTAIIREWPLQPWALAAAALLIVAVGVWVMRPRPAEPQQVTQSQAPTAVTGPKPAAPSPPSASPPQVVAVTLAQVTVRNTSDSQSVVIPAGTDFVDLRLEGDITSPRFTRARVAIRTGAGDEVWQGAAVPSDPSTGVAARAEIPADKLRPDDYIVELVATSPAGTESAPVRYALHVRAR